MPGIFTGVAHAAVTADFATDKGPVTSRYSGFHLGITETEPPDSVVLPLKPKFFGSGERAYNRAQSLGAEVEHLIACCVSVYPGDNGDWMAWEQQVRDEANRIKAVGKTNVLWEIWNEPDNSDFWKRSREQFFEAYRRAFAIIRSIIPGARITGPGFAVFDLQYLQDFLLFAKANDVVPNILSWHEILSPNWGPEQDWIKPEFVNRVSQVRQFMAHNRIAIQDIEIDEMFPPGYFLKPGVFVASAANLQRANIIHAGRACWTESGGWNNCRRTLDGIVTPPPNFQTRSAWWAQKAYVDLSGRYVNVTADTSFDGLASWDPSKREIRLALGNVGGSSATEILLVNLGSISNSASARVRVERIPNTEESVLSAPIVATDSNFSITGGELRIPISGSQQWDAYAITVTFSSALPPPRTRNERRLPDPLDNESP